MTAVLGAGHFGNLDNLVRSSKALQKQQKLAKGCESPALTSDSVHPPTLPDINGNLSLRERDHPFSSP